MSSGFILTLFISSLLFFVITFCLVRYYLYRYFINKGLAEDYWDFNFKSVSHAKYLYKIVFKREGGDFYSIKIRKIYYLQLFFLLVFIFSFFLMLS